MNKKTAYIYYYISGGKQLQVIEDIKRNNDSIKNIISVH